MAGPGNIIIKIGAEAGQAVSELGTVNKALGSTMTTSEKMSAGLKKAAIPAAAALAAIGYGAKKAIDAASNLNEQINKTATVFGPAGDEVAAWSATLAKSFGLSQRAALEAAGVFGNMLVPMGFSRTEAAKMSQQLVELAGDMASFNNASPEETLAALSSGLAGQSEPLRKFGVFLTDTRIKSEAMAQGLWDGKGALDAHAKASATMSLILKDTADAQGDFAKTSSSAANQTRIQAAQTENLSASLGQALLPAYTAIQRIILKVLDVTSRHTTVVKVAVSAVAALSAAILVANAAMKAYAAVQTIVKLATAAWTAAQWLLNAALSANPIGLVIVAVAALAAGLVIAYKKSETFREIVQAALHGVKVAVDALKTAFDYLLRGAKAAFDWVIAHWKLALFAFGPLGAAIGVIALNFDKVKAAAAAAWSAITGAWRIASFAFGPIQAAVEAIAGAFQAVAGAAGAAIGQIQTLIHWLSRIAVPAALHAIESAAYAALHAVEALIGAISRIHVPSIHIPKPFALMPTVPGPGGAAVAAQTAGSSSTPGAITVNVYGAVDPEGTARAIRRVLVAHDRRQGRLV